MDSDELLRLLGSRTHGLDVTHVDKVETHTLQVIDKLIKSVSQRRLIILLRKYPWIVKAMQKT